MENVKMTRAGDKLTIEIDLAHRGEKSASGKSVRVASTTGNVSVPGDETMKIGLNVYTSAK